MDEPHGDIGESSTWEHNLKHVFVLTSAGKPIFTRHGDEQELVTVFGLLQAMVSIVQDSGDQIQCIKAGHRRIVYFLKNSIYFIAVSSSGEPEVVLRQLLEFMHNQILFVLTSKVHDMLASNPSKDLRELLGNDTTRLLHAACDSSTTSPCIVYKAVRAFAMEPDIRDQLQEHLKAALVQATAAFGLIFYEDSLLVYTTNDRMQVYVDVTDVLLLAHFVHNSSSLRGHDQNCVPLCLPSLNAGGYVQAYISTLKLSNSSADAQSLSLILISATAADASEFKLLHEARLTLEENIGKHGIASRIEKSIDLQSSSSAGYLTAVRCMHYFYKFTPGEGIPAQCIWSGGEEFTPDATGPDSINRIWCQCFRLGACLREGASGPECTLLQSLNSTADSSCDGRKTQFNALANDPASDHALAYSVMESGSVVVGLATSDSELYCTFPSTVSALDACGLANYLTRLLRKESELLFQE